MEKFPTSEGSEKPVSRAESPESSEREKALGEARAFFEERAREAANPDSGNTYVGGAAKIEAQMRAYAANIEQGKFFDEVEYKMEGQKDSVTEKSAIAYLLDVRAKNVGLAELWAKDGKEDRAQKYRETAEKVDGFLEAFITQDRKKILGMRTDRRFVADEAGGVAIEGSGKERLAVINRGGSVERFVDTEKPAKEEELEQLRSEIKGTEQSSEHLQSDEDRLRESRNKIDGVTVSSDRKKPESAEPTEDSEKINRLLHDYAERSKNRGPELADSLTIAIDGLISAYPNRDALIARIDHLSSSYNEKLQEQLKLYPNPTGQNMRASNETMRYLVRSVLTAEERNAFQEAAKKEQKRMEGNMEGGLKGTVSIPLETSLLMLFRALEEK